MLYMMINPKEFITQWDIRPMMKVADFGCGAGEYAIEIAKQIGKEGVVYAFDVQQPVLSALKSRAKINHLNNIEPRRADLESPQGTGLSDSLVDFVVISNIFFQAENKENLAKEAYRILKPNGKAALIEWDATEVPMGPPQSIKVPKATAKQIFLKINFSFEKEFNAGELHYGMIFKKP